MVSSMPSVAPRKLSVPKSSRQDTFTPKQPGVKRSAWKGQMTKVRLQRSAGHGEADRVAAA
jgi:hypothetical protein